MANPEHVDIVRQGSSVISEWREHEPKTQLDLRKADLRGMNLTRSNLTEADLRGAVLSGANISRAYLVKSRLDDVDLERADLSFSNLMRAAINNANLSRSDLSNSVLYSARLKGTDLSDAILKNSILSDADLIDADLTDANLTGAQLNGTGFAGCILGHTIFCDLDLSATKGLDLATHASPSSLGIDTLYLSKGKLAEVFLRGCGVPESLITMIPSLIGALEPVQFYSCFISYSHRDEEFANRLFSRLRDEKLRVWFATEDMRSGKKIHEQIEGAIRLHDKLLLVLSEASMNSEWVKTEIAHAREREVKEGKRVLFPISIVPFDSIRDWKAFDADTGKDSAKEIREYFIPDFSNWKDHDSFEAAFKRLLKDLRAEGAKE